MQYAGSFSRDANHIADTANGCLSTDIQTLVGNNTTVNVPIFGVTGIIEVKGLWGIVTTVLGANHTASAWRINDQTAQIYLTAVGGVDISAATPGSLIAKVGLVAAALTYKSAAVGYILEPTTLETTAFSPIIIGAKTALTTQTIEYHYATTDAPTSGVIQFFMRWVPLSLGAQVTSL